MVKRTAVVMIHGIGEQVPMQTLTGFVDAVWTNDASLVDRGKPDLDTGQKRKVNFSWSKPDARNGSFELQLITTESSKSKRRIDFYEYYWAHRVTGTTWEQVRTWLFGLMLRNPFTNVPRGVLPAWLAMWIVMGLVLYVSLLGGLGAAAGPLPAPTGQWLPVALTLELAAALRAWPKWLIAAGWGAVTLMLGAVMRVMVDVVGDVVRYVEAKPKNIAIRQAIRENGVRLLESLMGIDGQGSAGPTEYDRIIVVGHSLGTIVAYDILTHAFGRHNTRMDAKLAGTIAQPHRLAMEKMVREALADRSKPFPVDEYRALQDKAREELNSIGNPWIVSDFVSLGSPLTHAEFLMAKDRKHLDLAKRKRILPTCPPMLEFDGKTKTLHFTFRPGAIKASGNPEDVQSPRVPHHAALFAYTRWTNIYSPLRLLLIGDIVSGPLRRVFGIRSQADESPLCGIKDVAVLPGGDDRKLRFLTHLRYWDLGYARPRKSGAVAHHIAVLREALDLGRP